MGLEKVYFSSPGTNEGSGSPNYSRLEMTRNQLNKQWGKKFSKGKERAQKRERKLQANLRLYINFKGAILSSSFGPNLETSSSMPQIETNAMKYTANSTISISLNSSQAQCCCNKLG